MDNKKLYEKTSQEALKIASEYDWDKVTKRQAKIFESIFFS